MDPYAILPSGPYAFFYVLAIATGFGLALREAGRLGLPLREFAALVGFALAGGILGSRLLHFDPAAPAGAKTVIGGVLLGALALAAGRRLLALDARAADALAPALPVALAVGRIGCLLAGCCFGHVAEVPWAVVYEAGSPAFRAQLAAGLIPAGAGQSLPVHPTQLYEALLALAVVACVPLMRRHVRRPGSLTLLTLAALGTGRLLLEFLRAREAMPVLGLTRVQWLLALAVGAALLAVAARARPGSGRSLPLAGADRNRRRMALALAFAPLLLAVGAPWFVPLERTALALLSVPGLLMLASDAARSLARRPLLARVAAPTAALAVAVLALQAREYPYTTKTFGVSVARVESEEERSRYLGEGECGPQYAWDRYSQEYLLGGASIAQTMHRAPQRSATVRLRGFVGQLRSTPMQPDATVVADEHTLLGGAADITWDRPNWGLTVGAGAGEFSPADDASSAVGIFGVRFGRLDRLHAFAAVNDMEPLGGPREDMRVGAGYGFGAGGTVVRAGSWREGVFLSATLPTGSWDIEPFAAFGDQTELRVAVRHHFGPR